MNPSAQIFEQIVSKPRLDSYRSYWRADAASAVGMYMWNGAVCGAMSQLLSHFEVALRNRIHRVMSEDAIAGTDSCHWWDLRWGRLAQDARDRIAAIRADAGAMRLGPDAIVSRLSFGFWPNMLRWMGKMRPQLLARVFPDHPLSRSPAGGWAARLPRRRALDVLFELKDVRNRIAHHEPLWKFPVILDTSTTPARVVAAASLNEAGTVARFQRLLRLYDDSVSALSPELHLHLRHSTWRRQLEFLLSDKGRARYRAGLHVIRDQTDAGTLAQHPQFDRLVQGNQPVMLRSAAGAGLFIPS